MNWIAVYEEEPSSVYDEKNILDVKYLGYEMNYENTGYNIYLNPNYKLTGKITLPTKIGDISISGIGTMLYTFSPSTAESEITHIFWADPPTSEHPETSRALTSLNINAFKGLTSLIYYEQPSSCSYIAQEAFAGCINLGKDDPTLITSILSPNVTALGDQVFANIGLETVKIPGHAYNLFEGEQVPFGLMQATRNIQIGSSQDPCDWYSMIANGVLTQDARIFSGFANNYGQRGTLTIYTTNGDAPDGFLVDGGSSTNGADYMCFGLSSRATVSTVLANGE